MEEMKISDLVLLDEQYSEADKVMKGVQHAEVVKEMEEMKIPDLVLLDENSSFPFTSQKLALLIVLIATLITAMVQLVRFQSIFKGQRSIFEGFALYNAIAFSSSFSSLFLHNKPGLARFCVFCSVASMASAGTMLLYAATYTQTSA